MGEIQQSEININTNKQIKYVIGSFTAAFFVASYFHYCGDLHGDLKLEQFAAIVQIFFFDAAIIAVTILHSLKIRPEFTDPKKQKEAEHKAQRDAWLLRLGVVTALGLTGLAFYVVPEIPDKSMRTLSVGLLTAGAAWLIAAVVGFLFGAPRTSGKYNCSCIRPKESNQVQREGEDSGASVSEAPESHFAHSTSLEEIADWLTKMIVGVGLTQLYNLRAGLGSVASFIAQGMGDSESHKIVAYVICIYFPACGFLFGFLWARLYLHKVFEAIR